MKEKFNDQALEQGGVSGNRLGDRTFEIRRVADRKNQTGEPLTPDEKAELDAMNEFGFTGNVRAADLVKKEQLEGLAAEETAELAGHQIFKGNARMAELHMKKILGSITSGEQEEYDISKELYYAEGAGEKPWRTHPDLYNRRDQLRKLNTEDK